MKIHLAATLTLLAALEADRPNVVARLKGNGKKRPLLVMGHTDTVNRSEDPSRRGRLAIRTRASSG